MEFPKKDLDAFYKAAASLKLYSRAELSDERNRSLIERLYIDALPNDQIFKTIMGNNTTIIVGRKGTGKSTVFQRAQHEIRKNKLGIISAYMDVRNIYESSQVDTQLLERASAMHSALPGVLVKRFLLHKSFFKALIQDIRKELEEQIRQNFLTRIKERFGGTISEVFSGLDAVIERIDSPEYENIDGVLAARTITTGAATQARTIAMNLGGGVGLGGAGGSAAVDVSSRNEASDSFEREYTNILMRVIGTVDIIPQLQSILEAVNVRHLYVFLDDFSELPEDAMHVLVDSLISPLTRWSDFVKFKVAAYPGRVYLGDLDKTKVEEVYLDVYGLYGSSGVTKMEEKATEFVKRVVERRLDVYTKVAWSDFIEDRGEDIWRVLYYSTMANPRTLGHILLYAYEANLLYGRKIGARSIQEAAQRYYEEKVASFFATAKYHLVFQERSSIFSLKELLENMVNKARSIRQEERLSARRGRPYSSHFYVSEEFEPLLSSLELSFFLTKYFEQADRDGSRVAIYALNYGLCMKYQIGFGRPQERREHRLYFVDRTFDYNSIMRRYLVENQEIKCENCAKQYDVSQLEALKFYHMLCPECKTGICKIINLSKKYGDIIESITPDLLLPEVELGILSTLAQEGKTMVASEIATELDCSGQLVGRRAKNLSERRLVSRERAGQIFKYEITQHARAAYFSDPLAGELDISE